jgi:hypothetical protein
VIQTAINPPCAASPDKTGRADFVPLTTVAGVVLLIEKPVQTVYHRSDGRDQSGIGYQFVWNVATNPQGRMRNLRFWVRVIKEPQAVARLTLDEVIAEILPQSRREFPAGTVCQMLQLRDVTLAQLRGELGGFLRRNSGVYPRDGLANFFRRRWLGASIGN